MSVSKLVIRTLYVSALCATVMTGCVDDAPSAPGSENEDAGGRGLVDASGQVDGSPMTCESSESEVCDGVDNDCDGQTDEGFPLGDPCTKEVGSCSTEGTWVCSDDGASTSCDAPDPVTTDELCDETDNDCDGETDEDFDLAQDAVNCGQCGTVCEFPNAVARCGAGSCGIRSCAQGFVNANGASEDGCECEVQNGGDELCNDLDDDCDGLVDEGFSIGAECAVGLGQCANSGIVQCAVDGTTECSGVASAPMAELCNGYDDDCDGQTDETFDADGDGAVACAAIDCAAPCPDNVNCDVVCANFDCNDDAPEINPQAPEVCSDEIDQNCDGRDAPCAVQVGRIVTLSVVPAGDPGCRDLDGDGNADNAFGVLAGIINPQIAQNIMQGSLNLFGLVYGIESSEVNARFDFAIVNGLRGRVHGSSLDENGRPINMFPGARIDAGAMTAGPRPFVLALPLAGGVIIELPTQNAMISGELTVPAELNGVTGCSIEEGLLTAALPEAELRAAVNATAPDLAPFLGIFQADMDLDRDGEPESLSVCVSFAVEPATIRDIPPPLGQ